MLRHRIRLPMWAAAAIPTVAYVVRSIMRGSLAPDIPDDPIVFGLLAFVVAATAMIRREARGAETDEGSLPEQMQREHDESGGRG